MAFTLLQAGSSLQLASTDGVLLTLPLPTGVTLDAGKVPRFAVFDKYVVMTNSPSRPLTIDQFGVVRVLTPSPPRTLMALTGTGSGNLTGVYGALQTFKIFDTEGQLIAESDFGPVPATASLTTNLLKANGLDISTDAVSASQIYRTLAGGAVYFPWIISDGNVNTAIQDDLTDASLALIAAPTDLGSPPNMYLIAEWKKRLWGIGKDDIDMLRYSGAEKMYGWPITNAFPIAPVGADNRGVTALIRRRDEFGVARRSALHKIVATGATFNILTVIEGVGCESQDSVVIVKDVAYFLGHSFGQFGIYKWDSSGVKCLSSGKVEAWFNTNTYFTQSNFQYAFGRYNPYTDCYEVHPDGGVKWIAVSLSTGEFYGPHTTAAITPTAAGLIVDSSGIYQPCMASSTGYIEVMNQAVYEDDGSAIDFDVDTMFHHADAPDILHYWGEPSLISRIEGSATTLTITPYVGGLDASAGTAISADLTLGRQRLPRLGTGNRCKLNFRLNTIDKGCRLNGYSIPVLELGRR